MWIFLTSEITPIKVRENNVDFSDIEITLKKVRENNVNFPTIEVTSKRVRGDDVDFLISEITSKKVVETTWKLVEIWSWTYQRNVDQFFSACFSSGLSVGKFQFRE